MENLQDLLNNIGDRFHTLRDVAHISKMQKVYQFDKEGKFLNEFDSVTSCADHLGIKRHSLTSKMSRKQLYNNEFYFQRSPVFQEKEIHEKFCAKTKVVINYKSGEKLIFNSIREGFIKTGLNLSLIKKSKRKLPYDIRSIEFYSIKEKKFLVNLED